MAKICVHGGECVCPPFSTGPCVRGPLERRRRDAVNDRPPGYVTHEQAVAELTRALNEVSRQGDDRNMNTNQTKGSESPCAARDLSELGPLVTQVGKGTYKEAHDEAR